MAKNSPKKQSSSGVSASLDYIVGSRIAIVMLPIAIATIFSFGYMAYTQSRPEKLGSLQTSVTKSPAVSVEKPINQSSLSSMPVTSSNTTTSITSTSTSTAAAADSNVSPDITSTTESPAVVNAITPGQPTTTPLQSVTSTVNQALPTTLQAINGVGSYDPSSF